MFDHFPQVIEGEATQTFSIDQSGLYAITVTARCYTKTHSASNHDEMLRIEINGWKPGKVPIGKRAEYNKIPPTWNGIQLKGLKKTIIFIAKLEAGQQTVCFISQPQATIEAFSCVPLSDPERLQFDVQQIAEYGIRRPWYTFALFQLPVFTISADVTVGWHPWQGDELKMSVDTSIAKNEKLLRNQNWAWAAKPIQKITGPEKQIKSFTFLNRGLPSGIHYIEFWANRTPLLEQVIIDLGKLDLNAIKSLSPLPVAHTPTVDDPKWTGNFADDTDQMLLARLIFGEVRNQIEEVMVGIGWVVKNRFLFHQRYFGYSYHEIILKHGKKSYQFSAMNPKDRGNFPLLINPLESKKLSDHEKWLLAYKVAGDVLGDRVQDPTDKSTFYHSTDMTDEGFLQIVPGAIFMKQIGDIRFFRGPRDK